MITLYAFKTIFEGGVGETKDLRAQWALEETGLPYRVHALDQIAGDLDSEMYRRISPFRQVPVIDDDGVHRFTAFAKAHQADIGNARPSSYYGTARDVYEEGALIFPAVQVQRGYRDIDDIIRMCTTRIRVPEQWYGD